MREVEKPPTRGGDEGPRLIFSPEKSVQPYHSHHNPSTKICDSWRCASPATVAHVRRFGGEQERLCARHWREAERLERVDVVRRRLESLFGNSRPRSIRTGVGIAPIAAPTSRTGDARGQPQYSNGQSEGQTLPETAPDRPFTLYSQLTVDTTNRKLRAGQFCPGAPTYGKPSERKDSGRHTDAG